MEITALSDIWDLALSSVPYVLVYLAIAAGFMVMSSFVAGYNLETWASNEVVDSLLWPLSLATLAGVFCRVGVEAVRRKFSKN